MQILNFNQTNDIMRHFPTFELSYETMSHRKVSFQEYQTCLAIPYGKKAYLWFTFFQDTNVAFVMEFNRDKRIGKVQVVAVNIPCSIALGTLLYGTLHEPEQVSQQWFVVEDVLYSGGQSLSKISFSEKLGWINALFRDFLHSFAGKAMKYGHSDPVPLRIALPVLWSTGITDGEQETWISRIPYGVHHYQYRSLHTVAPHINVQSVLPLTPEVAPPISSVQLKADPTVPATAPFYLPPPLPRCDFTKPQYRYPTIFEVKADIQSDIYHLYVYGKSAAGNRIYYGIAYIPNCKISRWMNDLFRNIKENQNLDAMEESDDEEDFQDMRIDKYVDLNKTLAIECSFHSKFKRWVPMRTVQTRTLVPMSKL